MATWKEFAADAPDLADFGAELINRFGAAFLATVRKSGAPRLHPVVPIIVDAGLYVFVNPSSPKFRDLLRDGRYVLHAMIDREDKEFFAAGRAIAMNQNRGLWKTVAAAAPYQVPDERTDRIGGSHFLFELSIESAGSTTWYHVGQPDTRPTHRIWRETTAQSR